MKPVELFKRERAGNYFKYFGAIDGVPIRYKGKLESIEIPCATIESMSDAEASKLVERQLRGLVKYMEECDAGLHPNDPR